MLSKLGGLASIAGVATGQPWLTAAGSAMGALGSQQFNAEQAQMGRDFQDYQSSTSMQRRVADLKAAGLSPMLAYSQGGAQAGGASTASSTSNVGESATSSGYNAKLREQELINMKEQEKNIREERWGIQVDAAGKIADRNRQRELLPFEKALMAAQTTQSGSSSQQLLALIRALDQQHRINEPKAKVQDSPFGIVGAMADRVLGTVSDAVGLKNLLSPPKGGGFTINIPQGGR
jgi:hypothetical protein